MKITLQLLLLILFLPSSKIFAEAFTYGELFLVDEIKHSNHEVYLSYISELDNSFENVNGIGINYNYYFNEFLALGMKYGALNSSASDTAMLLSGNSVQLIGPSHYYGIVISFVPLRGHINFLSYTSLSYDLSVSTSYGEYNYENMNNLYKNSGDYYSFSLRQSVDLTKKTFLALELTHIVRTQRESFDTSVNSIQFAVGMRW